MLEKKKNWLKNFLNLWYTKVKPKIEVKQGSKEWRKMKGSGDNGCAIIALLAPFLLLIWAIINWQAVLFAVVATLSLNSSHNEPVIGDSVRLTLKADNAYLTSSQREKVSKQTGGVLLSGEVTSVSTSHYAIHVKYDSSMWHPGDADYMFYWPKAGVDTLQYRGGYSVWEIIKAGLKGLFILVIVIAIIAFIASAFE